MPTRRIFAVAALSLLLLFAITLGFAIREYAWPRAASLPPEPVQVAPARDAEPSLRDRSHDGVDARAAASATPERRVAMRAPVPAVTGVLLIPERNATPAPSPAAAPQSRACPAGTTRVVEPDATYCTRADAAGLAVKDGPYRSTWKRGVPRAEGAWRQGKREGAWREWYDSGVLASQGSYREGRREGTWTFWRENGAKAESGPYVEDAKEGRWTVFDDAGHRSAEGVLHSDGALTHEEGTWTLFWPNGSKREQGEFREGRREGKWSEFAPDGRLVSASRWIGGEKDLSP